MGHADALPPWHRLGPPPVPDGLPFRESPLGQCRSSNRACTEQLPVPPPPLGSGPSGVCTRSAGPPVHIYAVSDLEARPVRAHTNPTPCIYMRTVVCVV
jgi:hypothetical protein